MKVPLDTKVKELRDIPHTISFVIRKRMQIDNLNELPEDKRPPESMIWDGTPEEIDRWLTEVFKGKKESNKANIIIKDDEIE